MIKRMISKQLINICGHCGFENTIDVSGTVQKYLPEFNQYENLVVECPNSECKSIEVFNMNIPVNDTDDCLKRESYLLMKKFNDIIYVY
jgi:hypothetical protein